MIEPHWLGIDDILWIHDQQIAAFGGAIGLRDEKLLLSALDPPRNKFAYDGETSLAVPGAAYAFGLAMNHPFIDGNKRTAFVACAVFLAINGGSLTASQASATRAMLGLASGNLSEQDFAGWLANHISQLPEAP